MSIDNGKSSSVKQKKRRGIVSSESEDAEDADYTLYDTTQSELKKSKQPEVTIRFSEPKSKTEEVKVISKMKLSTARDNRSNVSTKASSASTPNMIAPELQSEVVEVPTELPTVKTEPRKNSVSTPRSETSAALDEPIKSAPKPRSQGGVEKSAQGKMLEIIRRLLADPANELFRDPVPRSCEDYYLLIENPICLRDIRRKVEGNRYRSVQEFRRDLMLIVDIIVSIITCL